MDKSPMSPRAGGANHPLGDQFIGLRDCPSIQQQIGIAVFIVAMGPHRAGVGTKHQLMWPYVDYDDDDVRRTAARLLASVHTALLAVLPPAQIERISTDLDAYQSFVHGDGWPDDKSPFPASAAPAQG